MDKNKIQKNIAGFCRITGGVSLLVILALCLIFIIPKCMGYDLYTIQSDSMEPNLAPQTLIYVEETEPENIKTGDVITFRRKAGEICTHRVVRVNEKKQQFITKGDHNEEEDVEPVRFDSLEGRVVKSIPYLGHFVTFLQSEKGVMVLVGLMVLTIVLQTLSERLDPSKQKKNSGAGYRIGMGIGIALMLFAGGNIGKILLQYKGGKDEYKAVSERYVSDRQKEANDPSDRDETEPWKQVNIDFAGLKAINPEVVGWIAFDTIEIQYPVLQTSDDKKYLKTTFEGEQNPCGAIFMEAACASDFSDSYTLIYGHNMKDKSMFGQLKYYKTEENFYQNNRYFTIYTEKAAYRYEIFSYADVPQTSDIYTVGFIADGTFEAFLAKRKQESYVDTGVNVTKADHVIALSTCSTEGNRFVVFGKRIETWQKDEKKLSDSFK